MIGKIYKNTNGKDYCILLSSKNLVFTPKCWNGHCGWFPMMNIFWKEV